MSLFTWLFGVQLIFSCTGTYHALDAVHGRVEENSTPTTASLTLNLGRHTWEFTPVHGTEKFSSPDAEQHCQESYLVPFSLCKTFDEQSDTVSFGFHAINQDHEKGFENDDSVFGSINRITGKLDLLQKWSYVPRYGEERNVRNHDYEMSCVPSNKMF